MSLSPLDTPSATSPLKIEQIQQGLLCPQPAHEAITVLPASQCSWEMLTEIYNKTRVDYIVPMPMNVARMNEYVRDYDVDLDASVVALEAGELIGLAMLGTRPGRTWVTRLGILPTSRRHGLGQMLMQALIDRSKSLGARMIFLEVISGNERAYQLFKKLGFQDVRELVVLRRPPSPSETSVEPSLVTVLDPYEICQLLSRYPRVASWLNEPATLIKASNLAGLHVKLQAGGQGWLMYRRKPFQLTHLLAHTEKGDPRQVGRALLHALHTRHPGQDTVIENWPVDEPHTLAAVDLNYIESFRRIEMHMDLGEH